MCVSKHSLILLCFISDFRCTALTWQNGWHHWIVIPPPTAEKQFVVQGEYQDVEGWDHVAADGGHVEGYIEPIRHRNRIVLPTLDGVCGTNCRHHVAKGAHRVADCEEIEFGEG